MCIIGAFTVRTNQLSYFNSLISIWTEQFPLGSMNLLTYGLASTFDNITLRIIGTVMTASVCILWLIVSIPTARYVPPLLYLGRLLKRSDSGFKRGSKLLLRFLYILLIK